MSKKLVVGNLPRTATVEALRALFIRLGYPVQDIDLVVDDATPRLPALAYITLSPHADKREAINDVNGRLFEGHQLTADDVRLSEPRQRTDRVKLS
jgi:RNA recognition motif-containing protein